MAKLPIDIKTVLDTVRGVGASMSDPARIVVFVQQDAGDVLFDCVRTALVPGNDRIVMHIETIADGEPVVVGDTDLVILLVGSGALACRIAASCSDAGIPVVLLVDDLLGLVDAAEEEEGLGVPLDDVVYLPGADEDSVTSFLADLGDWIASNCPDKRIQIASGFAFVREPLVHELSQAYSLENALIGFIPLIPGADMPLMTVNQVRLLVQIASAYDVEIEAKRIPEIAAVVAGGFGWRAIARQLVKAVPVFGWAFRAGLGYTATTAVGKAAGRYFASGASIDSLREALSGESPIFPDVPDSISSRLKNVGSRVTGRMARRPTAGDDRDEGLSEQVAALSEPMLSQVVKIS